MRIKLCFKANISPAERQRVCGMLSEHSGAEVEEVQGCNVIHFSSIICVVEDIPLDHPRRDKRGVHGVLGDIMHCLSLHFGRTGMRNYEISVSDASGMLSPLFVAHGKAVRKVA